MRLLGISDEINICDCCGKSNLKKTFILKYDDGRIQYYGCDCYARIIGIKSKESKSKMAGWSILKQGVIIIRQHDRDFYTVWNGIKLLDTLPIETKINTDIVKSYQ